jgi:hypothetical protein
VCLDTSSGNFLIGRETSDFLTNLKGGGLVKVKAFVLIFLTAFAAVAATTFVQLSNRPTIEKRIDFAKPYGIVQVDNNGTVEPQKEIDTPGMPG